MIPGMMDAWWIHSVDWSRAQFAMTAGYHWLFVPLTLGLSAIVAIMETIAYRRRDPFWRRTTRFWMRLFGINFAIGIATGLILEFEFGTNWSNYAHFVGDLFGAPLAIEGILAFFLEATFVAVMLFGWERVSPRFHLTATWLTALGANLSAFWILVANAWMQHPVGMRFDPERVRFEMTSFREVALSPVALNKFTHTVTSSFLLAAVFVAGVSAWYLLRRREERMARASLRIAALFGLGSALAAAFTGDRSGMVVARIQPMKLAAMEALYAGTERAPLTLVGWPGRRDESPGREGFRIAVPGLLSAMSFREAGAFVPGIDDLIEGDAARGIVPVRELMERGRRAIRTLERYHRAVERGDSSEVRRLGGLFDPATEQGRRFLAHDFACFGYGYLRTPEEAVPDVPLLFVAFRVMVLSGVWALVLFTFWLVRLRRGRGAAPRWMLRATLWSIPLLYLGSQAGWVVAEAGRQPWTIEGLLPTAVSATRLRPGSVQVVFFLFLALFTALLIAEVAILTRQIRLGPGPDNS